MTAVHNSRCDTIAGILLIRTDLSGVDNLENHLNRVQGGVVSKKGLLIY
jgi:hypothetical protein